MTQVNGELEVKDLGSTNGIRINGRRAQTGRLRPGDVLSIAHIPYMVDAGPALGVIWPDPGSWARAIGGRLQVVSDGSSASQGLNGGGPHCEPPHLRPPSNSGPHREIPD
jgi:hypothetical protein